MNRFTNIANVDDLNILVDIQNRARNANNSLNEVLLNLNVAIGELDELSLGEFVENLDNQRQNQVALGKITEHLMKQMGVDALLGDPHY